MRKKNWFIFFIAGAIVFPGTEAFAQRVTAHWDFSSGKIESTDGRFKTRSRGSTRISGEKGKHYLDIGINNQNSAEGMIALQKYPELTPQGAFRLEIKARLRENTSVKSMLFLWDSIYHIDPRKSDPEKNRGFTFYLIRGKNNRFLPQAWFGFGKTLERVSGSWIYLEEYKDFTLALAYDGVKEVSFFLNGKLFKKASFKQGGTLAPADYPVVIGDRYGSSYNRFDGQILEVRLTAVPSDK